MEKKITPEAFQFVTSTVANLVHACQAICACDMDEGDTRFEDVNKAFGGKGKKLLRVTEEWLDILEISSRMVTNDFYSDYGIERSKR